MRAALLLAVASTACTSAPEESQLAAPLYTSQCGTQFVEGLDVYKGNGTIDWAMVKASGRKYAFIKATQGDYNKQTTFAANWTGAKTAGVLRSPYHFFDPTIDGVVQANAFLAEVAAGGGLGVGDLPPLLDIECPTSSVQAQASSGCEYAGNSGWVATATMKQRIFDWLTTVEQATGQKAFLYSYPSWFADVKLTDPQLAAYPLFIATYATCASVPLPWTKAVFWQYSATATVPGITGNVDVDHFFGTEAELQALTIQPAATDGGVPDGGTVDGGIDAGGDAGTDPGGGGGGCCRASTDGPGGALLGAALVALALRRRSRTR
jgi:GH25 family lysozyme M1 (1,4-beta-N-acetylmuramidase)